MVKIKRKGKKEKMEEEKACKRAEKKQVNK